MTPKCVSILSHPHPRGHIVYPYTDEEHVSHAVALYASAGLKDGEAVILLMTRAHMDPIDLRLRAIGHLNTEHLQRSGQLTYAVAEKLLPAFMVNGMPDEDLFKAVFGQMIERALKVAAKEGSGRVRAFGEMVSLLWNDSVEAAALVERFWDDLIQQYSISLLCTYALADAHKELPAALIDCHSHNIANMPLL